MELKHIIESKGSFNKDLTLQDYQNTKPFLNGVSGLVDTIHRKYPELRNTFKKLKSLDWSEDEFRFEKCNADFKDAYNSDKVSQDMADLMIETIMWQWEADSNVSQTPIAIISMIQPIFEIFELESEISKNECLIKEHEVFVKDSGWVSIADVKIGDIILTYDTETRTTKFDVVKDTIKKMYNDDLIMIKNNRNHFKQVVTKGHRMVTKRLYSTNESKLNSIEIYEANNCPTNGSMAFITSGEKEGNISSLTAKDKLWIAFQADGSYNNKKYNGGYTGKIPLSFNFKKERKKEHLREILKEIGYEYSEYNLSKEGYTLFSVKVPISEFIETGKTFDWIDLDNINSDWCKSFVDELYKWDGCKRNIKKCIVTYSSKSKQCIDIVNTISNFAGYRSKLYQEKNDCYQLTITNSDYVVGNVVYKTLIKHNDYVYCVTVESGAFVTKLDDSITVTGNCIHANTYSEIVRLSFDNPHDVMNKVLSAQEPLKRLEIVEKTLGTVYKEFLNRQYSIVNNLPVKEDSYYIKLIITMYFTIYCLERIQFMASFAITFTICTLAKAYQPIGEAVQKICQDEFETHCVGRKYILLDILKKQYPKEFEECKPLMNDIFNAIVDSEKNWTESLFENRSIVGIDCETLTQWILFNAADVHYSVGLENDYIFPDKNPMPSLNTWLSMNLLQNANQ